MLDRNLGEEEEMVRRWEWDRDCDSSERDLNDFISLSELREGGRKSRGGDENLENSASHFYHHHCH